jgi:UDP-N-acetylglucosamine--N-acetylmuramyl-(pentapeptide) pyrophosphoryl-undecaprenol N-acetylglucosamine transferase
MRIIFAGGGTGGHLFPGLAVARALRQTAPEVEIIFIGSHRGIEPRVLKDEFSFRAIDAQGLAGKGWWQRMKGLWFLVKATRQSKEILRELDPKLVMGLGGYSSGPVGWAAYRMGIPVMLQEQNLLPGFTNRMLGRIARTVFISFEGSEVYFPKTRTVLSGNPIRSELLNVPPRQPNGRFSLLITGGSQGSRRINQTMVQALELLLEMKDQLDIVHQTGQQDYQNIRSYYDRSPFRATVQPFIEDMGEAYGKADLVIARAGATTIAEITVLGKPAVLIPYPFAARNHQEKNARFLEERGAAKVLLERELTPHTLAEAIKDSYEHPEELALMRKRAVELGKPHAAEYIAGVIKGYLHDLR